MRGQVTIFIIVALLLVGAGFFVYRGIPQEDIRDPRALSVKQYLQTCIDDGVAEGVDLVSLQGGRLIPLGAVQTEYGPVAFAIRDLQVSFPSLSEVEADLGEYVKSALLDCAGNFSVFAREGLNISAEPPEVDVSVLPPSVVVDVTYPVEIRHGDLVSVLGDFRSEVASPLFRAHGTVSGLVLRSVQNPDWIDMSYLGEFEDEVELLPHNETVVIYALRATTARGPYLFLSAFEYLPNSPPQFSLPSRIEVRDGEVFTLAVSATDPEGDKVVCSDDTPLFDFTDCNAVFTPEVPGSYSVTITATDDRGAKKTQQLELVVS